MKHLSRRLHLAAVSILTSALLTCSILTSAARADHLPEPLGGEFQVNTYTSSYQLYPAVAVARDGSFTVVWMSLGSLADDNDGLSIQGQRFNSAGTAVGPQFQVNTYTTGYQRYPAIDARDDGAFVVVWQSPGQDGSGLGVVARRYDSTGQALAGEIQVNVTTAADQSAPAISLNDQGDFIVAWQDSGLDGDGQGIVVRGFDSLGQALGSELNLNDYTTGNQLFPSVALADDRTFVATWQSDEQAPASDIRAHFGSLDGFGSDQDCVVNAATTDDQSRPSVGIDHSGQAIVTWQDRRSGTRYDIRRRGLTRSPGSACLPGTETVTSDPSSNNQTLPTVAVGDGGQFVVAWSEGTAYDVRAKHISAQGEAGPEFVVNTTPEASLRPWVDFDEGGFVVTWTLALTADEVLAQRYRGDRFFGDGFETGDLSGWSSSVP